MILNHRLLVVKLNSYKGTALLHSIGYIMLLLSNLCEERLGTFGKVVSPNLSLVLLVYIGGG
jgi:hypothetical protein